MQLTKTHKIIISIAVLAILLGIYITYDRKSQKNLEQFKNTDTSQTSSATTTATNGSGIQVNTQGTGTYTITQVPITEGKGVPQPIPDLSRPVVFGNSVSLTPELKLSVTAKINELQTELKKNPANLPAWLDLGIYQKTAGDYQDAVLSWKYASLLAPTDYVSLGNIGNIYAYYIKDNAQAESYYKQAITKGQTVSYLYAQLFEVYRDVIKDTVKARTILDQGLAKIPNDPNLLQLQASLK
jgi:tetratricopeptide (TPR) repeat protein